MAAARKVRADQLRAGMTLLDPTTRQPAFEIDHRNRSTRNSGEVTYSGVDLDARRYAEVRLRSSLIVEVSTA